MFCQQATVLTISQRHTVRLNNIELNPTTEDLYNFIGDCPNVKVLVIGDLMLDRYLWGKVERISPEAPVPIVDIDHEENRLGGAANVALNIHALGATPVLCGVVGVDRDGAIFRRMAKEKGFNTGHIVISETRRTTVKVRIIGNNQQVMRVDREDRHYLDANDRALLLETLKKAIPEVDVIIFEDYDKGLLDTTIIQHIIHHAGQHKVPITVDPKFRQFLDYKHCTLFKPNLKELNEGLNLRLSKRNISDIIDAIHQLRNRMPHSHTLITLSEAGMLYVDETGNNLHVEAHYRDIVDVSGAGDTVISVISLALALGVSLFKATHFANLAGGLVCEEVGVVPLNPNKLALEAQKIWVIEK